jgi:hypothetical protein
MFARRDKRHCASELGPPRMELWTLHLNLDRLVSGGPNAVTGSFLMKGFFRSADGFLQLNPVSRISQPPSYVMVALVGTVSGLTYQGRVDGYRCSEFSVSRQEQRHIGGQLILKRQH